jgi:hypothetical protein
MEKNASDFLKHKVANALMARHGWDRNVELHKTEFDPENPNSQYAMAFDDATIAVETFIEALLGLEDYDFGGLPEVSESTPDNYVDNGEPEREDNPSIQKSASVFIFMDSGTGKPAYVGDVRDWLDEVDRAGIPDSTELDGHLYLSYDFKVDQIVDGEDVMTKENYILLTNPTLRTGNVLD